MVAQRIVEVAPDMAIDKIADLAHQAYVWWLNMPLASESIEWLQSEYTKMIQEHGSVDKSLKVKFASGMIRSTEPPPPPTDLELVNRVWQSKMRLLGYAIDHRREQALRRKAFKRMVK